MVDEKQTYSELHGGELPCILMKETKFSLSGQVVEEKHIEVKARSVELAYDFFFNTKCLEADPERIKEMKENFKRDLKKNINGVV